MLKNHRKLSRQLSLVIMLLAVPIFLLSLGALYVQSRYLIHEEVTKTSNSTLNTALHRIRNYMSTIETGADANAWMMAKDFRPDSLQSVSNRIIRLNPNIISSSVFAVPGMMKEYPNSFSLYSKRVDNQVETFCEPEYEYFDKACYTRPLTTGEACWVDPFAENIESKVDHNEAIATYCVPIKQEDGTILGVVTADLSFSDMAKILNEGEHPYPHAFYMLLAEDGRFLMYPDTTRLFRKTIFTDVEPTQGMDIITLGHEMTAGNQGTIHVTFNDEEYHVSYRPVPGTNWSLALVCPDSDAMKSFFRLGYVIIALLGIGLLVILLLCHQVVKKAIKPINKLIVITQQMADGHYGKTLPTTNHKEIIAQLQNSFAKMQQSLNKRMGSLRKTADDIRQDNEELNQTKLKAEDAVRRKNEYIQDLTQQIRMPQNVITGFANVLGESTADKSMISDEEKNSITNMMKTNVKNMNRMVLLLQDATETDATETLHCTRMNEVPCNTLVRNCVAYVLTHFPQANIQMETTLQEGVVILTSYNYLKYILQELLYNAARYSDAQHIILQVDQTDTTVRFVVQDKGPGLPANLPEQTFVPFKKTEEHENHTGMGLSLVKRYAVSLGGSMTIDTDYQEGCRIIIEMPK